MSVEAKNILLKNEQLLTLILEHSYVPQSSAANWNEVIGAMRLINPEAKYDTSCSGCMIELARMANIHLRAYKETLPKFYTFPKQ